MPRRRDGLATKGAHEERSWRVAVVDQLERNDHGTIADTCALCRTGRLGNWMDFGPQPLCNRFLATRSAPEYRHPLVIGQCEQCGLIQIADPVPPSEMSSRFGWLRYREPESHLDRLADEISRLPGISPASTICGLSSVDESLLHRLSALGFDKTWQLDPCTDFAEYVFSPGVEVIQARLDCDAARRLVDWYGRPDVVIGRYIVEHAHDLRRFLAALKTLVRPGGYVIVEVPDCERALEKGDYSAIWEEHVLYFTPATFQSSITAAGFFLAGFHNYEYTLQNALVVIGRSSDRAGPAILAEATLDAEQRRWESWVCGLDVTRRAVQSFLREHRHRGEVALFGAAQRGCSFVNLLDLGDDIAFVVDDDPNRQGFFMPGSRLPIRRPSALLEQHASLCLMAAKPESQDRVVRAHRAFVDGGGTFSSIYLDGQYALPV